jgi:hypothetical protein
MSAAVFLKFTIPAFDNLSVLQKLPTNSIWTLLASPLLISLLSGNLTHSSSWILLPLSKTQLSRQ